MTATIFPLPFPDGTFSLRFYQAGIPTATYTDSQWKFILPMTPTSTTQDQQAWCRSLRIAAITTDLVFSFDGVNDHGLVKAGDTYEYLDRYEPGICVLTRDVVAVTAENPTMSPPEDGLVLGPFTVTLASPPIAPAAMTIHWKESTVVKSATLTGTSTLGGVNAANLTAASINRTTGALSVTFLTAHAPDANSITIDYSQIKAGTFRIEAW